ncbi:MAG: toxin-antitoxin system YwqK family antitoxin [Saprospiraceae bacterium]|nr:toxin-antitoxin system YwqK family antitoxin [Saprospiraceae bacterium]
MLRLTYLLTLLSIVLLSCGNKKVEIKDENGMVIESYETDKKGNKDGHYKRFLPNGNLAEETIYKNGTITGERKIYYESGKLEILENYDQNGMLQGLYQTFYEDGTLKSEKTYQNNVLTGIAKGFHPNGKLKEEVQIENNMENGPFKEYHPNGQLQWQGTYLNGDNEFGLLEEYDSTGVLIKKMMCDSTAICRTIWKPGMDQPKSQNQ